MVRLPKGATAVDFAYHIHTEVRCWAGQGLGVSVQAGTPRDTAASVHPAYSQQPTA